MFLWNPNLCTQPLSCPASTLIWYHVSFPEWQAAQREVADFLTIPYELDPKSGCDLTPPPKIVPVDPTRRSENLGWPKRSCLSWNSFPEQQNHKHKQLSWQDTEPESCNIYRWAPTLLLSFARIYQVHLGLGGWQPVYHPRCPNRLLGHPPRTRSGGLPVFRPDLTPHRLKQH